MPTELHEMLDRDRPSIAGAEQRIKVRLGDEL
jgi:hypothetical protein